MLYNLWPLRPGTLRFALFGIESIGTEMISWRRGTERRCFFTVHYGRAALLVLGKVKLLSSQTEYLTNVHELHVAYSATLAAKGNCVVSCFTTRLQH